MTDEVREFLTSLAGGKDIDTLRAEADRWKDSGDLNEEYLAWVALRAAELLAEESPCVCCGKPVARPPYCQYCQDEGCP